MPTTSRPVARMASGTVAAIAGTTPSGVSAGVELSATLAGLALSRSGRPHSCQPPTAQMPTNTTAAPAASTTRRESRGGAAFT